MALALEIAFALGLAIVALSFVALARGRAPERYLLGLAVALAIAAVASAALLAVNLADRFTDIEPLVLVTGGFAAAAVAELGLVAMSRGLRRIREVERVAEAARADLGAFVEREIRE